MNDESTDSQTTPYVANSIVHPASETIPYAADSTAAQGEDDNPGELAGRYADDLAEAAAPVEAEQGQAEGDQ